MTIWIPDLSQHTGPKYRAIADALADDISAGKLPPDTRLPTHRDLAWKLGVTVGTVSRAYALAQSRGLIAGEVGRGTRVLPEPARDAIPVREAAFDSPLSAFDRPEGNPAGPPGPIVMNQNFPADPRVNDLLAQTMQRMADPQRLGAINGYLSANGLRRHRIAARDWLSRFGIERQEDSVLTVNGCQHGLSIAFMTLAGPGDTILAESLTWPGAKQLAAMLGLKVLPVAIDEQGILPDAFEAACREAAPRLLYTVPTLHNPTASILPEARRRAIAEIAVCHGVHIVEDDVFGYMIEDAPPPISAFAPDHGIYITSLSKPVAPILRAGFISAPLALVPGLAAAVRATALMPSPLNAEIAAELILSGAAEAAAEHQRKKAATRQAMAVEILGDSIGPSRPRGTHIWMTVPPLWTGESFAAEALARGVAITPGKSFAIAEDAAAGQAVRLCISAEIDQERVREGLEIIAELLKSTPQAVDPIV